MTHTHSGFEPRTRDPERRDFFDLRRRIGALERGEEVFIGPNDPGTPYELWYDTDAPGKTVAMGAAYVIGPLSDQNGIGATMTDLTGMSVTWIAESTHVYLIQATCMVTQRTAVGSVNFSIRTSGGTELRQNRYAGLAVNTNYVLDIMDLQIGLSGSTSRKLSMNTSAGTVDVEGNDGRFTPKMFVLDLGAL